MASGLYGLARQAFLDGDLDWSANDIKMTLVDTADYTVNIDTHQYYSSVTAAGRVATSSNFTSKTSTLGVADADNVTFPSVSGASDPCEALVIWQDSGSSTTSRVIAYIDSTAATGLPISPNGGDITVAFDSGANKIFKL